MARGENQKLKMLYILDYLTKNGSPKHGFTMEQLLEYLNSLGVNAERKSIYDDFTELSKYGVNVEKLRQGSDVRYYTENRRFTLSELKLLVDAVQSSKFISPSQSNELIKKLEAFASDEDAKQLQRQVFVFDRVKNARENGMESVDVIHEAMRNNHQITFIYCQWDVHKKLVPRREGAAYAVSPWALIWDNENYYLAACEEETGILKHYRVDKMQNVSELQMKREGQKLYANIDLAAYTKKNFGMFGGEEQNVKLLCDNSLAGVIIDRFGASVMLIPQNDNYFHVTVRVFLSPQFFGWVAGLGNKVRILGPEEALEQMKNLVMILKDSYEI